MSYGRALEEERRLEAEIGSLLDRAGAHWRQRLRVSRINCRGVSSMHTTMAGELLATATQREITQLDGRLYLELFGAPASAPRQRA